MRISRNKAIAVLVGVVVAGVVGASASTLGGLGSDTLGADTGVVASCDTDGIGVSYTTSLGSAGYVVTAVEFTGVAAACDGLDFSAELTGTGGSLAGGSGTAAAGSFSWTPSTPVPAEDITGVALVITGAVPTP